MSDLSKEDQALLDDPTVEKNISFTITVGGTGRTVAEAWDNMLEGFYQDPGVGEREDVTAIEVEPEED